MFQVDKKKPATARGPLYTALEWPHGPDPYLFGPIPDDWVDNPRLLAAYLAEVHLGMNAEAIQHQQLQNWAQSCWEARWAQQQKGQEGQQLLRDGSPSPALNTESEQCQEHLAARSSNRGENHPVLKPLTAARRRITKHGFYKRKSRR
ncbi:MAG: hypothetical protein V3T60_16640 [Candidatus Binatia bacterium]